MPRLQPKAIQALAGLLLLTCVPQAPEAAAGEPRVWIVAPGGRDDGAGTLADPASLQGAQALLRAAGALAAAPRRVLLRGGLYPLTATFALGPADAGTQYQPVVFAAYPGERPRLSGGVLLAPGALRPVDATDPLWARLAPEARAHLLGAALPRNPWPGPLSGDPASRGDGLGRTNHTLEVFVDGRPLTLARYPKAPDATPLDLTPHASGLQVGGHLWPDGSGTYACLGEDAFGRPEYGFTKAGASWRLQPSPTGPGWSLVGPPGPGGERPRWGTYANLAGPVGRFDPASGGARGSACVARADGAPALPGWLLPQDTDGATRLTLAEVLPGRGRAGAMYFGFGCWSWWPSHAAVAALGAVLDLAATPRYGLRPGQPCFLYNLPELLTDPWEYVVAVDQERLYLRLPPRYRPREVLLSMGQAPLVRLHHARSITLDGLTFEAGRDTLVEALACEDLTFRDCTFRNSGGTGLLLDGYRHRVERCAFDHLGKGGLTVSGGDRTTLTPSGTEVSDCRFQDFGRLFWSYEPGIRIRGVGVTVEHNELHHAPHAGVIFEGNDHRIRRNHCHHLCQWSNDAGVLYTGRDWGSRGTRIEENLIRDNGGPLGHFVAAIYLDDCASGIRVERNLLYETRPLLGVLHAGGRDVTVRFNVAVGHHRAYLAQERSSWINAPERGPSWRLLDLLKPFQVQRPPWSTAYPELAALPKDWEALRGSHWLWPEGSVVQGNLHVGSTRCPGSALLGQAPAWHRRYGIRVEDNVEVAESPFLDGPGLDFRLRPSCPLLHMPGFEAMDPARIGPRQGGPATGAWVEPRATAIPSRG